MVTFTMTTRPRFTKKIVQVLCLSVLTSFASADPFQDQIDALQQRIDSMEADTDEMRSSLDMLRSDAEREWLTEERSVQIKTIVHDILSDADSRTNLMGDGLLGGWDEGFFIASSDGRFKLKVGGLLQERYILNHLRVGLSPAPNDPASNDRWRGGFENTRTRLNISGHIFDRDTTFLIQPGYGWRDPNAFGSGFVGTPMLNIEARLWDAWIKFKLSEEWSAKVGIFTMPFTRESLVSDQYQLAVDRSLIDYRIGLGRSQGVQFTWANEDARVFTSITNGSITLGSNDIALNADGTSAVDGLLGANQIPPWSSIRNGTVWSSTTRMELLLDGGWSQCREFTSPIGASNASMIGIAFHAQRGVNANKSNLTSELDLGVTADYSLNFNGGSFFVSGTYHNQKEVSNFRLGNTPNVDWVGYVVQGSVYTSSTSEVFLRFEGGGAKQELYGGDDVHILTTGVNWYLDGQDLKVTSDFGWSFGEISQQMQNYMVGWRGSDNQNAEWLFRTQLQLSF